MLIHVPLQRAAFTTSGFKTGFLVGAGYISFVWMLYPICWGLSEGSNTISPTSEMVFYGILDLLSAPVFLLFFMVYLTGFTEQDLSTTAFGSTDRGEYVETAQKGPPQPTGPPPAAAPPA
jgi:bacteriorhodopsin